jgi:flagellar basal-body rod protein FlgB
MQIFSIASQRTQWLSARLSVIAGNVANASTPGYRAKEITPFAAVLEKRPVGLARTNPAHLNAQGVAAASSFEIRETPAGHMSHSGNTVSLEKEMLAGAETVRSYRLATNVERAFHRMFLMSLKDN